MRHLFRLFLYGILIISIVSTDMALAHEQQRTHQLEQRVATLESFQ